MIQIKLAGIGFLPVHSTDNLSAKIDDNLGFFFSDQFYQTYFSCVFNGAVSSNYLELYNVMLVKFPHKHSLKPAIFITKS